jgi:glutaredoxin 3
MPYNTAEVNAPSEDDPGYTVFGRIVSGWATIEAISRRMKTGFLKKEDRAQQVTFEKVEFVEHITHEWPEVQEQIELIDEVLDTPHTVIIFTQPDCEESKTLKQIFIDMRAATRTEEIGNHADHPYELKTVEAMTGTDKLPVVMLDRQVIGSIDDVNRMLNDGSLKTLLENSGAMAEDIVWTAIHQNPLVVFSKSYCPYCKKAKETLRSLGANPVVFELDLRSDGVAIQEYLYRLTDRRTVPNVFIKGKSIGGGDDTEAMYKSGQLKDKLRRAGAIS